MILQELSVLVLSIVDVFFWKLLYSLMFATFFNLFQRELHFRKVRHVYTSPGKDLSTCRNDGRVEWPWEDPHRGSRGDSWPVQRHGWNNQEENLRPAGLQTSRCKIHIKIIIQLLQIYWIDFGKIILSNVNIVTLLFGHLTNAALTNKKFSLYSESIKSSSSSSSV